MLNFKNVLANCADSPHCVLHGIIFSVFSGGYINAMLNKPSATKSYVSCDSPLSLLQLLDLPVVSAVCCLSSTHTSTIDSRVTAFWRNHFVEHEADTRILIISGPSSRRLKAHYLQFFTTRLNYGVTFPACKLR